MFILLFKKQMTEMFRNYFVSRKTGKMRSKPQVALFIALFAGILMFVSTAFLNIARTLASVIVFSDNEWLYYALLGILSLALGIFGSVFSTYSMMYLAKDNDLLLSMPIRPSTLLDSRMASAYVLSLIYEAVVYIPAVIEYLKLTKKTALNIAIPAVNLFVSAFAVLALTCFFGWIIAAVSTKINNKNAITMVLSLALFAGYYVMMFKFQDLMRVVLNNADKLAGNIRRYAYPMYLFGKANTGDIISFLLFALIAFGVFAVARVIMSRTFIRLATANKGFKKKSFKESVIKAGSVSSALFSKEVRRLISSPVYLLNSGLGMLIAPVIAVIAAAKGSELRVMLNAQFGQMRMIFPALVAAAVCLIFSMDNMTAPSVSLEGKSIWIVKSLPVNTKSILLAKIRLHFRFNIVPAEIAAALLGYTFGCEAYEIVAIMITVAVFIFLSACTGLMFNLLKPDLNWTSEVIPVKQDPPVIFSMLSNFILVAAGVPVAYLLSFINPAAGVAATAVLYAALSAAVFRWINTKGVKIFETL